MRLTRGIVFTVATLAGLAGLVAGGSNMQLLLPILHVGVVHAALVDGWLGGLVSAALVQIALAFMEESQLLPSGALWAIAAANLVLVGLVEVFYQRRR